ncbi:MAG: TRAP transporter small permease [Paracoccaceae bacterium]
MNDWSNFIGLPLWFWLFILPSLVCLFCLFFQNKLEYFFLPIWKILDFIYHLSGIIAAISMCLILLIIIAQMVTRWTGIIFEGSTEFAGYAMASTSFFALAYALGKGSHIRVSIFLNLNSFTKKWLDVFALFIASIIATFFARYAIKTNFMSEILNDRTQGQDQIPEAIIYSLKMFITFPSDWIILWSNYEGKWVFTPVWIPQLPMSIGTILLAICLWDHLLRLLVTKKSAIKSNIVK